jgi:hypothetical protein|tara:strand:+ start:5276 stop:5812 length:537 start_codon:yes stop_codon:yes gene_type:complete
MPISRFGRDARKLVLALVLLLLVPLVAASSWSSCGKGPALQVDAMSLDPASPRLGDHVKITVVGELHERIDASFDPQVVVSVFYRVFAEWVLVDKTKGPLCADFICPVEKGPNATVLGGMDVPYDAPPGWYRLTFRATQNATNVFCVDCVVKFRAAALITGESDEYLEEGRQSLTSPK